MIMVYVLMLVRKSLCVCCDFCLLLRFGCSVGLVVVLLVICWWSLVWLCLLLMFLVGVSVVVLGLLRMISRFWLIS